MSTSFTYDVAISYVAEDSLTARQLITRLRPRLHAPIFDSAVVQEHDARSVPGALASDSRIVVVLHQRLWGQTLSTQRDLSAIQERVDRQGDAFLLVVQLEPGMGPMDGIPCTTPPCPLSSDYTTEVEAILGAVQSAGGQVIPLTLGSDASAISSVLPDLEDGGWSDRSAFRSSYKIATASQREVIALIDGVEKGVDEIRAAFRELDVEVRRSPNRCVLQAGEVGLSLSWLHRPVTSDEGGLLLIEWDGTVTFPGERARPGRRATVAREQLLHLETVGSPEWNWSEDDAPARKYSSADLASLCVQLVMRRLRYADSVIGTGASALLM
jgi:hypothetical protein